MISHLIYLGATHKTAAMAIREQLAAGPERIARLLDQLQSIAEERIVLSTCGRFEIYMVQDPTRHPQWPQYLSDVVGLSANAMRDHIETLRGEAAANRALRVAAGLESKIVGEHQILGQVRRAFESARLAHATGLILSAMFRSAIHTGKRVRSETSVGHQARSYAGLAVDAVRQALGTVTHQTIAIFGSGAMAREAAALLSGDPRHKLIVISGHADRAAAIANEYRGRACTMDALPGVLAEADAMICCASSRWGILELNLARRPAAQPLTIVDLGMPRNVDPSVGGLPGIRLLDLDRIPGAMVPQVEAVGHAEQIVSHELDRLLKWIHDREVAPLVARLHQPHASLARRRELHRAIIELKEGAAA